MVFINTTSTNYIEFFNGEYNLYQAGGSASNVTLKITNAGAVRFPKYSGTLFQGIPTYMLGTDSSGNVVKVLGSAIPGVSGQFLLLAGGTLTGDLKLNDTVQLRLGTGGNDLKLYHDGSDSYMENGTGDVYFMQRANDKDIYFQCDDGTGGDATYIRIDGGAENINMLKNTVHPDSVGSYWGDANDLQIQHNGSNTLITNNVGNVIFTQNANDKAIVFSNDNGSGGITEYFRVDGQYEVNRFLKNARFNDSVKANFGTGDDLQIQHTGSTGIINNQTGGLFIKSTQTNGDITFEADNGSGGVATYFFLDGGSADGTNLYTKFPDSSRLLFGTGEDLQIYHDGSNSKITEAGQGDLFIGSNFLGIQNSAHGTYMAKFDSNGSAELYYNNSKKFETSNAGVAITGSLSTTQDISVSGNVMISGTTTAGGTLICESNITIQDSDKLQIGNSQDLELYHSGGNSFIVNETGNLKITQGANDGDVFIENDNGSGGTTTYLMADGGTGALKAFHYGSKKFETISTGVSVTGVYSFSSTGSGAGFQYGTTAPTTSQGICLTTSDTGGAHFDGVGKFQNTNTGQGAGLFQMINYGALYGRYMQFFRGSTSNIIGYIGYNNTNTSVTFSTTNSDIRTKKNITTWDENVLDKFKALQPKRFDFKAAIGTKGAVKERGFIAQYEKDNFPEAYQLNGNDEKATYGFHPMEMVPYMMKAIKDLTIKNEELERRIKTLES